LGAVVIWTIATGAGLRGAGSFSNDYLPTGAVVIMVILIFLVNPIASRISRRLVLNRVQMCLIFGILLVACITPGQGLLLAMPFPLAQCTQNACEDGAKAAMYKEMDAPASLFPDELGYGNEPFAAKRLLTSLEPGEEIPWKSWIRPLISWMGLFVPWWVMMIAIAVIALPQWRDRERVSFPLLEVMKTLSSAPEEGHALPAVFRDLLFLLGLALAFVVCSLPRANGIWPGAAPVIPLSWKMDTYFTEGVLKYLPGWVKGQYYIYFTVIGLAFFMQRRVSASIWSLQLIAGIMIAYVSAYSPPFEWGGLMNMKVGVHFAFGIGVLWLARSHLAHIARTLIAGAKTDDERRDRSAAIALLLSLAGMCAWFTWVGVHPGWTAGIVTVAFIFGVVYARIVAETGLPIVSSTAYYGLTLINLVPVAWRTATSMYFSGIMAVFVGYMNRVCAATVVLHALGLDEKADARKHVRLGFLFLGVLVASVLIAGDTYLYVGYTFERSFDGYGSIVGWWRGIYAWTAEGGLSTWSAEKIVNTKPHLAWYILVGMVLAGGFQWLCAVSPKWPLHPLGLLLIGTWTGHRVWFSVMIGWMLKTLVVRYGGARAYTRARGVFLGLIIGEVLAAAFWGVLRAVLLAKGII
jgi:hypothetical protein